MTDVAVSIYRVAKVGDVVRVNSIMSGDDVTSVVTNISPRGSTSFKAMINAAVEGSSLSIGARAEEQRVYDLWPAAGVCV